MNPAIDKVAAQRVAGKFWKTKEGEKLEIAWMQSVHIVHSFNMMLKKQQWSRQQAEQRVRLNMQDAFENMYEELRRRRFLRWSGDFIVAVAVPRETPKELAMLRAILDTAPQSTAISQSFRKDTQAFIDKIMAQPGSPEAVKFVEYRLAHS